jgi:hypothetical protein
VHLSVQDGSKSSIAAAIDNTFELWGFSGFWNLLVAMFPESFRPYVEDLAQVIDYDTARKLNNSWDVIYAATRQLAEAYVKHHPEVELQFDKSVKGACADLKPLAITIMPSESALLAKLLHTTSQQCVAGLQNFSCTTPL